MKQRNTVRYADLLAPLLLVLLLFLVFRLFTPKIWSNRYIFVIHKLFKSLSL